MNGFSSARGQRGSALTLAILMLVVLSSAGIGLMVVAGNEATLSQANVRTKQAFYLAEAGQEDGRLSLFAVNGAESFDDDLVAAAGANGTIDFDPDRVRVTHDADGNATGLTGHGDDVPLQGLTTSPADGTPPFSRMTRRTPLIRMTRTIGSSSRGSGRSRAERSRSSRLSLSVIRSSIRFRLR